MNKNLSRRKFLAMSSMSGVAFTPGFNYPVAAKERGKLCNAIFDLTGKRIKKLPFKMQEL